MPPMEPRGRSATMNAASVVTKLAVVRLVDPSFSKLPFRFLFGI